MKTSIHYSEEICKRLEAKKLTEIISPYAMEYINTIMLAIFSTGYHGKTVDMEKCSDKHRTSISRFLHNDQWNASSLEKAMKELVIHTIYEEAERIRMKKFWICMLYVGRLKSISVIAR